MSTQSGQGERAVAEAIAHFDHHSRAFRDQRENIYREMLQKCPVIHSKEHGGFHVAADYETVFSVGRDSDNFSSALGRTVPPMDEMRVIPHDLDLPESQPFRHLLNPLFSPKFVAGLMPDIVKLADELLDGLIQNGRFDVATDYAQPLTGMITLRILGMDISEWKHYITRLHKLAYRMGTDAELSQWSKEFVVDTTAEIARQRERPTPGGVIETLLNSKIDDRKLTEEELVGVLNLLLAGGLDSTQAVIGNSAIYMARNPAKRQELLDYPDRWPNAVDEFLRYLAPTQAMARTAKNDVVLETAGGLEVKAGERVLMIYAAANRDPKEFPQPDNVDFTRIRNRHFSFGIGAHRCLGSHLARAEILVALRRLVERVPNFRIKEEEIEVAPDVGMIFGHRQVPIFF